MPSAGANNRHNVIQVTSPGAVTIVPAFTISSVAERAISVRRALALAQHGPRPTKSRDFITSASSNPGLVRGRLAFHMVGWLVGSQFKAVMLLSDGQHAGAGVEANRPRIVLPQREH